MALTQISTNGIKDSNVTSSDIADQAVTLDKLPHGTSSNDGKFLRANNGADPTFETVSIPAGTTINTNAANRVVTGSGTANTLTANSDLLWNGSRLDIDTGGTEDALRIGNSAGTDTFIRLGSIGTTTDTHAVIKYDKDDNYLSLLVSGESHGAGGVLIANGGNVGIGTASPSHRLHVVSSGTDTALFKGRIIRFDGAASSDSPRLNLSLDGTDKSSILLNRTDSSLNIETLTAAPIIFDTNSTERMRIDASGNVSIGSTYGGGGADPIFYVSGTSGRLVKIHNTGSATSSLQITNAATGQGEDQGMQLAALANGECIIANAEAERILIQSKEADNNKPVVNFMKPDGPSNATTVMIAFETGNQGRGAILSSSSDGGSPSFTNLSDYRIKTNIRNYTDGYNNIKAIPVKLFDMTSDETKDIKGWIAHEVQAYIPEAVMGDKDAVDSDGKPIFQQLSYGLFMPDVVSALQTAIAKIETLETKVAALEAA